MRTAAAGCSPERASPEVSPAVGRAKQNESFLCAQPWAGRGCGPAGFPAGVCPRKPTAQWGRQAWTQAAERCSAGPRRRRQGSTEEAGSRPVSGQEGSDLILNHGWESGSGGDAEHYELETGRSVVRGPPRGQVLQEPRLAGGERARVLALVISESGGQGAAPRGGEGVGGCLL